ncbi:MAG: deoxyribonuclease IV [Thermodesulfobacteriota bacterium]
MALEEAGFFKYCALNQGMLSPFRPKSFMRLGFHLSIAGSLRRAVTQAQVLGCQALQIFVQNPRGWKWREVPPKEIRDFIQARCLAGLSPLVVHLGYLPNLAAADPALYGLSSQRLFRELALARDLAADYLVVHPGHGPLEEASFQRVARALALAVSQVPPPPLVLLENTAGQGQELGWRFQHLERIITLSSVPLGLCLDTAHAWGAGYDLGSPHGVARLLSDIVRGPGLDALKIIHLNDSRVPCNGRRDRHWHLGRGAIGLAGLRHFFSHPWLKPEAAIMETPKQHQGHEWVNLLTARSLMPGMLLLPASEPEP